MNTPPPHGADPGRPEPACDDLRLRFNPPSTGVVDSWVRRHGFLAHSLAILSLYVLCATALAIALAPGLWFAHSLYLGAASLPDWQRWPVAGFGIAAGAFLSGLSLLIVVPLFNWLLPTRVRSFSGGYYSLAAVPWALHNGLFYLVRYTFLPYATLSPFGMGFLRAMGMKIGRRVFINTEFISDPRLIEIGDDAVIGGSVHLFAHYGGGGHLHVAPVRIGARVTIGQKATVMGDVVIADGATVLPHSVVLPGSRIGAGETWGGVPARPIPRSEIESLKAQIHGAARPGGRTG